MDDEGSAGSKSAIIAALLKSAAINEALDPSQSSCNFESYDKAFDHRHVAEASF